MAEQLRLDGGRHASPQGASRKTEGEADFSHTSKSLDFWQDDQRPTTPTSAMAPKDSKKSKSHLILDLYIPQDPSFFPTLAQEITGLSRSQSPIPNIYSHIHRRQSQQAFGESKCCCQSNSQGCKDHNLRRVRTASLTAFFDIYCWISKRSIRTRSAKWDW